MSATIQNTGVSMMLKAMGFDPQLLIAKGLELEAMGKVLAAELAAKVSSMETRMAHMEQMMIRMETLLGTSLGVISRLESAAAGISPAGDSYEGQTETDVPGAQS